MIHDLKAHELMLTGESVPVRKIVAGDWAPGKGRRPGGDDLPYVFSGSLVVRGTGIGEVIATGALSEIGQDRAVARIADPFWADTHRFSRMVIDPVCSLVFEAETEDDDVMRRPPRGPHEPLFSGPLIGWSLLQGAFAFVLVAVIFVAAFRRGMPEEEVRALAFFSLILTIVSLIFVNRSFSGSLVTALRRPNSALALILLAVTTMLSLTLLWPFARDLFRFGPLHLDDLALTLGSGVLLLVFLEGLKLLLPAHAWH